MAPRQLPRGPSVPPMAPIVPVQSGRDDDDETAGPCISARSRGCSVPTGSSAKRSTLAALEDRTSLLQAKLQSLAENSTSEVAELRDSSAKLVSKAKEWIRTSREEDSQEQAQATESLETLRSSWREAEKSRVRAAGTQAAAAQQSLASLSERLASLAGSFPDIAGQGSSELSAVRTQLEDLRQRRREAGEEASKRLSKRLAELRQSIDEESPALSALRDKFKGCLEASFAELRLMLEDERLEREERCAALREVVNRTKASLMTSCSEENGSGGDSPLSPLCSARLPLPSARSRGAAAAAEREPIQKPHSAVGSGHSSASASDGNTRKFPAQDLSADDGALKRRPLTGASLRRHRRHLWGDASTSEDNVDYDRADEEEEEECSSTRTVCAQLE